MLGGDLETAEDSEQQVANAREIRQQEQNMRLVERLKERSDNNQPSGFNAMPSTSIAPVYQPLNAFKLSNPQLYTEDSVPIEAAVAENIHPTSNPDDNFASDNPELEAMLELLQTTLVEFEDNRRDRRPDSDDSEEEDEEQEISTE